MAPYRPLKCKFAAPQLPLLKLQSLPGLNGARHAVLLGPITFTFRTQQASKLARPISISEPLFGLKLDMQWMGLAGRHTKQACCYNGSLVARIIIVLQGIS